MTEYDPAAETAFALLVARNPQLSSSDAELRLLLKEVWMSGWVECELHRLRKEAA